jgi:hypothetical protein
MPRGSWSFTHSSCVARLMVVLLLATELQRPKSKMGRGLSEAPLLSKIRCACSPSPSTYSNSTPWWQKMGDGFRGGSPVNGLSCSSAEFIHGGQEWQHDSWLVEALCAAMCSWHHGIPLGRCADAEDLRCMRGIPR